MADDRFDSVHLYFPRRQDYRQARDAVRDACGVLTRAGEQAQDWLPELEDWKSCLPQRLAAVVPGMKYLLIDRESACSHPLKTGLNTIGRFDNNDIVLDAPGVSRRHCVLLIHARGGCELHDTASTNGTFLNDQPVQGHAAPVSGDVVRIVKQSFIFVSVDDYLDHLKADAPGEDTRVE